MEAHVRAGIDVYGRILRYAEVEQYGSRYRLLRLGTCDFDFDVVDEVLAHENPEHVETVSNALGDIFSGSIAGSLNVTIHPPACYSFFTPLPAESDSSERKIRLQQEASLLAGTEQPLHITADAVRSQEMEDGTRVDWVHVLAVDDRIHGRIRTIIEKLPHPRRRMMVSMQGAARSMAKIQRSTTDAGPSYSIAVGAYPHHIEYTLSRDGAWYFSNYSASVPTDDLPFFALSLLQRFGLSIGDVGHLFVYGNDADPAHFSGLESVADIDVRRLDPFTFLDLDSGTLSPDFDAESYVGCVGVTL